MSVEQSETATVPVSTTGSFARIVEQAMPDPTIGDQLVELLLRRENQPLVDRILLGAFKKSPGTVVDLLDGNRLYDHFIQTADPDYILGGLCTEDIVEYLKQNLSDSEIKENFMSDMDLSAILEAYDASDVLEALNGDDISEWVNSNGSFEVRL
jgi:hypothetical protein